MSSQLKPITIWGQGGPNPPKIIFILKELDLPHEIIDLKHTTLSFPDPEYLTINPNGRVPSIRDPNNGNLTLWESGAIVEYLIETYDKTYKLSFPPGSPESYLAKQWLFYQTTGQGPYYGQALWFKRSHPEKLPSAIERYVKEVNRVSSVLEGHLVKEKAKYNGTPWLVGNKCSYADISFITYQVSMGFLLSKDEYDVDNYPCLKEWLGNLTSRKVVKDVLDTTAPFSHFRGSAQV